MPALPIRPNLDQLRHQAKDLLADARRGDARAVQRVGTEPTLSLAHLAMAREYGCTSWSNLKSEIERRDIFESTSTDRLATFLSAHPNSPRPR